MKDWGIRLWDWQTDDPPTAILSPRPPKPVPPAPGSSREDVRKYEVALDKWHLPGMLHPRLMTRDGNRFFSTFSPYGRFLLDLKNPNAEEGKAKDAKK